jgi:hypothetical protein
MGSPIAQVAPSTQPQGKGFQSVAQPDQSNNLPSFAPPNAAGQAQGKGGNVTIPSQGEQPKMGMPNNYPNTVGQWDNATIGSQQYEAPQKTQAQPAGKSGGKAGLFRSAQNRF